MIPLTDSDNPRHFPLWVLAIIAVNVYVFYLELTVTNPDALIYQYAFTPALLDLFNLSTWIPLITSQFLHGGFLHIISNMLFLWVFGNNVEHRLGILFFPIFYLASGVTGGLLQYLFIPSSEIPMLGASGAVAGVLGAYFALFPHHKIKTLVPVLGFVSVINLPASFMLFYWFITQIFSGASSISVTADVGGVAYFAHIGGFALGWIVGKSLASTNSQVSET